MTTLYDSDIDGIEGGRKIGFDQHFSAPGMSYILPCDMRPNPSDIIKDDDWRNIERKKLAKLEISGIWKATKSNTVNMRISQKIKQVKKVKLEEDLPIIISVIEFGTPKVKLIKK